MYASLESTRPAAASRAKDPKEGPLLCGSPVSGISYLDRPQQAGYFIYPDLSVRHEGKYRLSFTLYEELKDPSLEDRYEDGTDPEPPMECVYARCTVRSAPFTVFSAKKFPGLSSSTSLSRTVAEQGCRIRIRRDVRMRKREAKDSKAWASDDEESVEPSQQQAAEPASPEVTQVTESGSYPSDQLPEPESRPRVDTAVSNAAVHPSLQRTSAPDLNAQYQQQNYSTQHMMPPNPNHSYPGPPPRSSAPLQPPQFDPQVVSPHYGHYMQPQPMLQSPQPTSQCQQQQPPPPPAYGYQGPQMYGYHQGYPYMTQPQMHSPMYPPSGAQLRHDSLNYVSSPQEYQTAPGSQYHTPVPGSAGFAAADNVPSRSGSLQAQPMQPNGISHAHSMNGSPVPSQDSQPAHGKNLPPIQTQQAAHRPSYDASSALNPQATSFHPQQPLPPYTPSHQSNLVAPPAQYITPMTNGPTSNKRSYASTFDTQHFEQRLQGGARPDIDGQNGYVYGGNSADQNSEDESDEPPIMEYRRADGSLVTRQWPKLH